MIKNNRVYLYPVYEEKVYKVIYMQGHSRKTVATLPFDDSATESKALYNLEWNHKDYCQVTNMANKKSKPIRINLKKVSKDMKYAEKLEAQNENI